MQQFHIDTNLIEYIRGIDIINIVIKNKIDTSKRQIEEECKSVYLSLAFLYVPIICTFLSIILHLWTGDGLIADRASFSVLRH